MNYALQLRKWSDKTRSGSVTRKFRIDYWVGLFKLVDLTDIMRQREDIQFARVLNTLRTREMKQSLDEQTKCILHECLREGPDDPSCLCDE